MYIQVEHESNKNNETHDDILFTRKVILFYLNIWIAVLSKKTDIDFHFVMKRRIHSP